MAWEETSGLSSTGRWLKRAGRSRCSIHRSVASTHACAPTEAVRRGCIHFTTPLSYVTKTYARLHRHFHINLHTVEDFPRNSDQQVTADFADTHADTRNRQQDLTVASRDTSQLGRQSFRHRERRNVDTNRLLPLRIAPHTRAITMSIDPWYLHFGIFLYDDLRSRLRNQRTEYPDLHDHYPVRIVRNQ